MLRLYIVTLLINMLDKVGHNFSSKEQDLLISWLQPPPALILEPQNIKYVTVSTVSPSISHEVMGPEATILVF